MVVVVVVVGRSQYGCLNRLKAETRTDGADLTLFIWREFGERDLPPAIEGPSIAEVVRQLRYAFLANLAG